MEDEITKQKNEKISVNITGEMTVDEFAEKVKEIVYANENNDVDASFFLALLESKFENWDIAIEQMNHFDYLKKVFKEEVDTEWEKYTPKLDSPKDILNRNWNE